MAKIGLLLLSLIQWSNVYAWYCNFSNGEDGWYLEDSMQCVGIDNQLALEQEYCGWFRPNDPICSEILQPTCVDSVEYITETCPPNHSGGIQKARTFICQQASWTDWQVTSNNCTPNPPTCISTSDSRNMACPSGYDGQIIETRIGNCPDPYGEIQFTEWLESTNTCVQSTTDPISPISVTSPTNPVSPIQIESVTVPIIDVPQTNSPAEPTIESVVQEELNESADKVEPSTSDKADSPKEVKQDKQDGNEKNSKDDIGNVVDNSKEIVHGFGLVLSLEILNKPMEFYQPPLADMFSITQEFPIDANTREFQLDLLKRNDIEDYYNNTSDYTWERIRRSDILQ
jgi:hypothetical protein